MKVPCELGSSPEGFRSPNWAVVRRDLRRLYCEGLWGLGCLNQASVVCSEDFRPVWTSTFKTSDELGKQDVQKKANSLFHLGNRTCMERGHGKGLFNW